jgi:uncharacterized protein GlcG (DUF336 family)
VDEVSILALEYLMSSISLAQAQTLIAGALAVARQKAYKPMGVVVVDTAAQAIPLPEKMVPALCVWTSLMAKQVQP